MFEHDRVPQHSRSATAPRRDRRPWKRGNPSIRRSPGGRVPNLRGKVIIEGAGHWVQAEKPAPVNEVLIPFLKATK